MEPLAIGALGMFLMFVLIILGVPVAFAMGSVAILGLLWVSTLSVTLAQTTLVPWQIGTDFVILCVPLFILMGQLVFYTGIASDLYDCVRKWVGHLPGGLAIAGVIACGGFGAVTGSSVASVATMGSIIYPELKKYGYDKRLATGTLAASGSLAILIPPSLGFAFYGILTDTSIAALFVAGIIPGTILVCFYSLSVFARCKINLKLGPPGPKYPWKERILSLKGTWPVFTLFLLVVGGMYGGLFTPTEASGIGALGVFVIGVITRRMKWNNLKNALRDTGLISGMVFAIIIGGYLISRFLAVTGLSQSIADHIASLHIGQLNFILIMVIIYLILGCLLDVFGIMILTIPFVFPIVTSLKIDPVWFGVFTVIMCEVGLLTPPVGLNVYVMHGIVPEVPMKDVFIGIMEYTCFDLLLVGLITAFPDIPLWLTRTMTS